VVKLVPGCQPTAEGPLADRDQSIPVSRLPLLAAVGGSMVTRTSSRRAFQLEGRGLVTQDMLPQLGKSFSEVFGKDLWDGKL